MSGFQLALVNVFCILVKNARISMFERSPDNMEAASINSRPPRRVRSPSTSPSRSPPPDFTRSSPDASETPDRKGKGKDRHDDESQLGGSERPSSRNTYLADAQKTPRVTAAPISSPWPLQSGDSPVDDIVPDYNDHSQEARTSTGLTRGFGNVISWRPPAFKTPVRNNLGRKQRALWTWANASDLDAFLSEVDLNGSDKCI